MPNDSFEDLARTASAEDVAAWGDAGPRAAAINYDVPLPGVVSWQRVVPLDLQSATFAEDAGAHGADLVKAGAFSRDARTGALSVADLARLKSLYRALTPDTARPSLRVAAADQDTPTAVGALSVALQQATLRPPQGARPLTLTPPFGGPTVADTVAGEGIRRASFLDTLADRQQHRFALGLKTVTIPAAGIGNSIRAVPLDPTRLAPTIAIVETWDLRSSLGDYGLGKTLETFSLFPTESTTITIETWRSEESTREDASSVFDSCDTAAQTRFTSSLTENSGVADQDQGGWAASVDVSSSGGFNLGIVGAKLKIEAGYAANHQEAHQEFSNTTSESASEHASQVNSARRQNVQSSSSSTTASGSSTTTVREITNTNLRRVLNFVFRELNQTYETLTVLRDVRVAFYNGNAGSAETVSLGDLRRLLEKYVKVGERERVARTILGAVTQVIDETGAPVTTLEVGTRPKGVGYVWKDAALNSAGELDLPDDPLDTKYRWRFKPGALGKHTVGALPADNDSVRGVITGKREVVLRTDQVVAEALLGQADALDPYASALQSLDLRARAAELAMRTLERDRLRAGIGAMKAARDPVDAYERMFNPRPASLDADVDVDLTGP